MLNIDLIIFKIDEYLKLTGQFEVSPVEANRYLSQEGILKDSSSRPGKPLRELLRNGMIPHAYKDISGSWHIPHSNPSSTKIKISGNKNVDLKETKITNNKKIQDKINNARLKYKPENIKCLIIAEAPPDSLDRFFYYEDVKTADYLFLGIMEVLYPDLKNDYLNTKRNSKIKEELLEKFKNYGYFLMDVLDVPLSKFAGKFKDAAINFSEKLENSISKEIPIILIKDNVYDSLFSILKNKGFKNVSNVRIPFPGYRWQIEFKKKFKEAIERIKNQK